MASTGTSADLVEEGREFLQQRVAAAGLAGVAGFGGFLLYRLVNALLVGDVDLLRADVVLHAASVLPLLGMWALCRSGRRSAHFVRWMEALGLLLTTLTIVAMGQAIPISNRPDTIVHSALTFGWTARTIYVPSSTRRTVMLTALAGIPILVGTYVQYLDFDPAVWVHVEEALGRLTPRQVARFVTINTAAWWLLTVALCAGASRVIYGLRREVRAARRLGQYTLEEKLGEGGMGMVYRASHAMLRRPTAVKLLLPEKAGASNLARFEREVQLTAQLSHPNTVRIYDYGRTADGTLYYAMELLDGATLERVVQVGGAQPAARVVHILSQVVSALGEAHGIGLIHRDIKPSNIILCEQGGLPDVAKVVDFGLVKDVAGGEQAALTSPELITGTPLYMPPEAITDPGSMDGRSDLYALGAVGYFLLTGTHVFEGKTLVEICGHHLHSAPEPPTQRLGSGVPQDLERLILDCLAKSASDRPRDASDMLERLHACSVSTQWSEAAARDWWGQRAPELQRAAARPVEPVARTELRVDLAERAS